jgi:hypothetical protein
MPLTRPIYGSVIIPRGIPIGRLVYACAIDCQVIAKIKRIIPDKCNAIRYYDIRQAGAIEERGIPDRSDAIRYCDIRQAGAIPERGIPDRSNAIRYCDIRQAGAIGKCIISDRSDAIRYYDTH